MRKSRVLSIDPGDESATVDCQALIQIVGGLARSGRTVDRGGWPPDQPRSLQLISTEAYDVWLITWPPGSTVEMHHHGSSTGVTRVAAGELVEWTPAGERRLGPKHAYVTQPDVPHRLVNLLTRETTTVHAYSPPLRETTYDPDALSRSAHPAGLPVRSPEASSRRALQLVH